MTGFVERLRSKVTAPLGNTCLIIFYCCSYLKKPDTRTYISTYLHSCNIHVEWREKRVNDLLTRGEDGKMVKTFFNKLKLGTLSIGGLSLIIFGAAGYASFAEEQSQCGKDLSEGRYIVGTFIPEQKK